MEVQTLRRGESGTYRIAAFPTAARSYVTDAGIQRIVELLEDTARRACSVRPRRSSRPSN
jgi:hypothetical protein